MKENIMFASALILGMIWGMCGAVPDLLSDPSLPVLVLSVLVFQVGINLGMGDVLSDIRKSFNLKIVLVPFATIVGTLAFTSLGTLIFHQYGLTDILAIGSGFGYYSLSSVMIADIKSQYDGVEAATTLATVSLLTNVCRELIAVFGCRSIAKGLNGYSAISVAGINSMDVCLPMIQEASRDKGLMTVSIIHGIALEVSVPILVSLFCGAFP